MAQKPNRIIARGVAREDTMRAWIICAFDRSPEIGYLAINALYALDGCRTRKCKTFFATTRIILNMPSMTSTIVSAVARSGGPHKNSLIRSTSFDCCGRHTTTALVEHRN